MLGRKDKIEDLISCGLSKDEAIEVIEREYALLFNHDILKCREIGLDIQATDGVEVF